MYNILTVSILLLEKASKAEENAPEEAHSWLLFVGAEGLIPGVAEPNGSASDIEPFIWWGGCELIQTPSKLLLITRNAVLFGKYNYGKELD